MISAKTINRDATKLLAKKFYGGKAMKMNCWEFTHCGRQPGGEKSGELGICNVSVEQLTHGVNNGINGGRACWAVKRKFNANADVQCSCDRDQQLDNCLQCEFYSTVREEEGDHFVPATKILALLKSKMNDNSSGIPYKQKSLRPTLQTSAI